MTKSIATVFVTLFAYASVAAATTDPTTIPEGTNIGEHVPQFTAQVTDLSGAQPRSEAFDSHQTNHVTAYIFVGTTCPATNFYAGHLKELEQTYRTKGVDFVYLYPNANDTSDAKLAFHKEKQLGGRLIDDKGGQVARLFKAQRTTEVFVTNAKGIVVYHGAIDDARDPNSKKQQYLAPALDETLAGKPVTTSASQVFA
jgi:hypothetical protein